jgi:hypothetical protein
VIFAEPDRLSPGLAADSYKTLDDETRAKLRALPGDDDILTGVDLLLLMNQGRAQAFGPKDEVLARVLQQRQGAAPLRAVADTGTATS